MMFSKSRVDKTRKKWRDAIATTEKVLTITAIWPSTNQGLWYKIQVAALVIIVILFDISILVELKNLIVEQDYEALSTHLSTLGLYIGYTIKIVIFQFQKKEFKNMLASIEQPLFEDYPPQFQKYKNQCISISNHIALFYISCVACSVLLYLNRPLYTDDFPLPISFSYDLDSWSFLLVVMLQCFSCYYLVMIGISFDMIIIGLINIATAQLDILIESIESFEAKDSEEEERFLKKCARRHRAVITYVSQTENVFTYIFMTQCLSSVTSICNGAFQLTHTGNIFSIHFLFNCAFAFDVLFEIGICCWFAGLLTIKSLEVSDAFYNYNWSNSNTKTRKLLVMMIARSQKPLFITAGKFAKLSMTSYLKLLKTAYSYFALMQTMEDKKKIQLDFDD